MTTSKIPFWKNISQLRKCISVCLFIYISCTGIAYFFSKDVYVLLCAPLSNILSTTNLIEQQQKRMIFSGISDPFFLQLKIASTIGLMAALPIMFIPVARFALPGLKKSERIMLMLFSVVSLFLFLAGVVFAYHFAMPTTWNFMASFEDVYYNSKGFPVVMNLKADEYFGGALKVISSTGFAFQIPLIAKALHKIGIINIDQIRQSRRYAIVVIFVLSAFLTPPDVISQVLMAIPMMILYEVSILFCHIGESSNKDEEGSKDKARLAKGKADGMKAKKAKKSAPKAKKKKAAPAKTKAKDANKAEE